MESRGKASRNYLIKNRKAFRPLTKGPDFHTSMKKIALFNLFKNLPDTHHLLNLENSRQ